MTQRRNSRSHSGRSKEVKSGVNKNGRPVDPDSCPSDSGPASESSPSVWSQSWLSLGLVLALVCLWSSVAVVYFDVVDYDSVLGKLSDYDTDGDGDFDLNDARVLLGLQGGDTEPGTASDLDSEPPQSHDLEKQEEEEPGPVSTSADDLSFVPDDDVHGDSFLSHESSEAAVHIDSTGELVKEPVPQETTETQFLTSSRFSQEPDQDQDQDQDPSKDQAQEPEPGPGPEPGPEPEPGPGPEPESEPGPGPGPGPDQVLKETSPGPGPGPDQVLKETSPGPGPGPGSGSDQVLKETSPGSLGKSEEKNKAKKKKLKLLNKFDKNIKNEIDSAEKLRRKGRAEEALQAFEALVLKYPQSPRARFGKAQSEDDVAELRRSNQMLQRAISSYREASELPDVPEDIVRAALRRRAERQQFLGRTRGSLQTLEKLVQMFPDEVSLKNDLGVAHLLLGDNAAAKSVYEQVLALAPDDGFAKVHFGFILKSENKISESVRFLQEGLESEDPGTDDGRFYFHLGDALQRLGRPEEAHEWYARGHLRGHFASVWQRSLYNVDGLKAQPWWTPRETGYSELVKALEKNWRLIRDEALAVLDLKSGLFLPEEENLRETGDWGQYTLYQQGRRVGSSCQNVPQTCSLMEKFPEATGCKRGQIKFSVMKPGTHVWPHTGPTNCRLRLHLGLVVPQSGCRIRCTDTTRTWEEGKVLIFDDSFEHEVWQEAESLRLIFIVDVWHPELTPFQRQTLSAI